MKINIIGWYGKRNVGDEAFRYAHKEIFKGHDLNFITPPMKCRKPDIVVLGGGAVASPFYLSILPNDIPRYALGIDLAYKSEADLLAEAKFKSIIIRTKSDVEYLKSKVSCPVQAMPDLAFMLKPSGNDILSRYKRYPKKKTLGVLVTDYVNPAIDRDVEQFAARAWSFKLNLAKKLDAIQSKGWEVVLIPCSTGGYGDDRRMNLDLAAFMEKHPTNIIKTFSPQDTIDLIAQLDLSLCMRFHAHIFSIIAGTPLVSIDYTRKVQLLLEENDLVNLSGARFDGDTFNVSDLDRVIDETLAGKYKDKFLNISRQNYNEIHEVVKSVRSEWLL